MINNTKHTHQNNKRSYILKQKTTKTDTTVKKLNMNIIHKLNFTWNGGGKIISTPVSGTIATSLVLLDMKRPLYFEDFRKNIYFLLTGGTFKSHHFFHIEYIYISFLALNNINTTLSGSGFRSSSSNTECSASEIQSGESRSESANDKSSSSSKKFHSMKPFFANKFRVAACCLSSLYFLLMFL